MSKRYLLHTTALRTMAAVSWAEGADVSARRIEVTVTAKAPLIERMGVDTSPTGSNYIRMRGPMGTGMSGGRMLPPIGPHGRGKSKLTDLVRRLFGEVPA